MGHDAFRWAVDVDDVRIALFHIDQDAGKQSVKSVASVAYASPSESMDIQITDDGSRIGVYVGSELVFGRWIDDDRQALHDGVEVTLRHGRLNDVIIYPRTVELPPELCPERVSTPVWGVMSGFVDDDLAGVEGDLAGRPVAGLDSVWSRTTGRGRILVTPNGGQVDASASTPLAGRTVYTIPNPVVGISAKSVELEIDVLAPGSGRDQGEKGRAGVVFWQDDDNVLFVSTWLDDHYAGTSVSSFFRLGGFEELYDAIWTNVGTRIAWGRPYRLRVAFDGNVYTVSLDDELMLYRSLTDVHPGQKPLRVNRVGIVANWEWGNDTGSLFRRFSVRSPTPAARTDNA